MQSDLASRNEKLHVGIIMDGNGRMGNAGAACRACAATRPASRRSAPSSKPRPSRRASAR